MGLTLDLTTFHLKAEILNLSNFCPFSFPPNTFHSHKFNCVLFKHYLSVPFLIWRPQATSVLGVFPCSPISKCWEKRFQCSVLTKCSHEWRPFHFTLYGLTDSLTTVRSERHPLRGSSDAQDAQDINQIFFPLSSQHHNVRYWPSLPSHHVLEPGQPECHDLITNRLNQATNQLLSE